MTTRDHDDSYEAVIELSREAWHHLKLASRKLHACHGLDYYCDEVMHGLAADVCEVHDELYKALTTLIDQREVNHEAF